MNRISVVLAVVLLLLMAVLAGGAAVRESITIDEVAHIGAGVSYLQKLDMRMNGEHPPLAKVLAATPLVVRGSAQITRIFPGRLVGMGLPACWANGHGDTRSR